MTTLVEIITPVDTVAFYPTPDVTGFVYDNDTLDRWYAQAPADAEADKRPNAHGAYGLGQVFTSEHKPIIGGQYYGASKVDALEARNRLARIFNDGQSVTMRVTDELEATTREVWLVERDAPFPRGDFTYFPFDLVFVAPDPRRYAATYATSGGLPSPSSGLVWNLGTSGSGLYFDWGTPGALGQVAFTNTGAATTHPRIEVAGAFTSGFRITEIETGRELTLERDTATTDVVTFDSRTQRATLNGGDVTGLLTSRDWFEIPTGETRRYQINPLGATSGSPTITLYAAPAYM